MATPAWRRSQTTMGLVKQLGCVQHLEQNPGLPKVLDTLLLAQTARVGLGWATGTTG